MRSCIVLIYKITKNALEEIRIETTEYQGKEYLSVRVWFDASRGLDNDWRPSQKGITLSVDLVEDLQKGINKATYEIIQKKKFSRQRPATFKGKGLTGQERK